MYCGVVGVWGVCMWGGMGGDRVCDEKLHGGWGEG